LIPSALTSYQVVTTSTEAIEDAVEDELRNLHQAKDMQLAQLFEGEGELMRTMGGSPGFVKDVTAMVDAAQGGSPAPNESARLSSFFNASMQDNGGSQSIVLVEKDAGSIILAPSHPDWEGYIMFNTSTLVAARISSQISYRSTLPWSNRPAILCSEPVRNDRGAPIALLVTVLDDRAIEAILSETVGLGSTGAAFLVGGDGRLLSTIPGGIGPGERTASQGASMALDGESGYGIYSGASGNRVMGVYSLVGRTSMALVVEIDRDEAMEPRTTIVLSALAAGVIVGWALVIISVVITRELVRDLDALVGWAKEIGRGNWDAPLELGGTTEFKDLEDDFRQMVRDLEKQQSQIRAVERRYANLFRSSLDPVYTTSRNGTVMELNTAGERILGLPKQPEGSYGIKLWDLFADELVKGEFERRLDQEGAVAGFEAKLRLPSGREVVALMSATRRLDDEGRILAYQGVIHDITDRKRFETALVQAKNEAEFYCDVMSHDLNNAIQGLGGYLELATFADSLEDVNEFLPAAQDQLNRATKLLINVRRMSHMGDTAIELGEVDLRELLERVTKDVARLYAPGTTEFNIELPDGSVKVLGEEFLEDVFFNLLDNAMKYDSNDVKSVDIVAKKVTEEGMDRWQVRVLDHGPGVTDRDKHTIFHRFERKALKEYGTGLGLSIVVKATDRCGGRAWVEDRVDGDHTQGAAFVVELLSVDELERASG
jgi:PAS domain S-box-containing protein